MKLMPRVVGLLIQTAIFVRIDLISWKTILWLGLMLLSILRRHRILRRLPILRRHQKPLRHLRSSNQKIGEYNT